MDKILKHSQSIIPLLSDKEVFVVAKMFRLMYSSLIRIQCVSVRPQRREFEN